MPAIILVIIILAVAIIGAASPPNTLLHKSAVAVGDEGKKIIGDLGLPGEAASLIVNGPPPVPPMPPPPLPPMMPAPPPEEEPVGHTNVLITVAVVGLMFALGVYLAFFAGPRPTPKE